jgi:hypothetical protein
MAFKTREERAALRTKQTPYTVDDIRFRGKNIRRGVVKLSAHTRAMDISQATYRGEVERDGKSQTVDVVFAGQRYRDFAAGRVPADFQAEHERNCDAGNYDADISRELIIEGFWKPRFWKDRDGNQHKSWELHAAKWHYSPDGETGFVEEGALPSFD